MAGVLGPAREPRCPPPASRLSVLLMSKASKVTQCCNPTGASQTRHICSSSGHCSCSLVFGRPKALRQCRALSLEFMLGFCPHPTAASITGYLNGCIWILPPPQKQSILGVMLPAIHITLLQILSNCYRVGAVPSLCFKGPYRCSGVRD